MSTLLVNMAFAQAVRALGVVPTRRQLKWHETEDVLVDSLPPTTFENRMEYGDAANHFLIQRVLTQIKL
jgi:hypothetical protein